MIKDFLLKLARRDRLERTFSTCPPGIADALLEILYYTMLEIRQCDNLEVARIAASHAHNVPDLIRKYSSEKLQVYWETDRPFLERSAKKNNCSICSVESAWRNTEAIIKKHLKN